jgi:hypothetical protein
MEDEGWKSSNMQVEDGLQKLSFPQSKVLGENLLSKKFKAQKVEAGLKVMLYNKFISL